MSKSKLVYLKHNEIEFLLERLENSLKAKARHQKLIAKLTTARNTKIKTSKGAA